jgi:lysozyme family protein
MDAFVTAWNQLLGNEGGFVDNPADPGGATMYGVTERVARQYGYTGDMRNLPLSTAQAIAKQKYWDRYSCEDMDARIAFQVLDAAYNGGHPAQWLQAAVGTTQDGIIGPKTLAAVAAQDVYQTILRFNSYRLSYLASLDVWPTFGRGWSNRIARNLLLGAENVT